MTAPASRSARLGWVLYDWASQPFFTLVTTFVFAPYFTSHVVADPERGQALWGYAVAVAGLVVAGLGPVLGAIADRAGRRKPWIMASLVLMAGGCWALWYAAPGNEALVPAILAAFVIATIGAEMGVVFTNAMMPGLAPADRLGRLSGQGWAAGYAGGLVSLALVLGLMAADPATGRTLAGLAPIFGLDAAAHEGARASGPFSALWLLAFAWPLLVFTPDRPRGLAIGAAARAGLADLGATLREARANGPLWRFLIGHMAYVDGLAALFAFGGIYAAGVFGWTIVEVGLFGIGLTFVGVAGALAGGWLDDRFGPKPVVIGSALVLLIVSATIVSIGPTSILFVVDLAPGTGAGLYDSPAEKVYFGLGLLIGVVAGPLQASSRTWLLALAPAGREAQMFGLLQLSGKATSFLAPAAVATATALTGSQRLGVVPILAFLALGLALVAGVPGRNRPRGIGGKSIEGS